MRGIQTLSEWKELDVLSLKQCEWMYKNKVYSHDSYDSFLNRYSGLAALGVDRY